MMMRVAKLLLANLLSHAPASSPTLPIHDDDGGGGAAVVAANMTTQRRRR